MNKMNIQPINLVFKVIEFVELSSILSPIVLRFPILDEFLKVSFTRSVIPTAVFNLVRETSVVQAELEIFKDGGLNVDGEGTDRAILGHHWKGRSPKNCE
tara:strand:+ start:3723 stop:4022 length:300 start_codon:yes stop_codon:yes gene_type:complete